MKLNTKVMPKAIGIGLAIELVMIVISEVVNAATGAAEASAEEILSSGASGALGAGLCISCVMYLLYGVIGAIYSWFAHKDQGAIDAGSGALGGGITAVIVSVIGTAISSVYSLATGAFAKTIEQATDAAGISGAETNVVMAGAVGGLVIGFCIAFVLSALFGAGGGAIYAAIAGRGQTPDAAPSV